MEDRADEKSGMEESDRHSIRVRRHLFAGTSILDSRQRLSTWIQDRHAVLVVWASTSKHSLLTTYV